ncbi:hypothetical protein BT93_C0229 [Corymbia citriodora subsp. variegata]|nr:hypothetical protein BT93_C0229 [Corymbia citriodora subsp. variegata]
MEDAKLKRATEPSSSTVPKRQRREGSNESPSEEHESGEKDLSEKMPSESGANSGPSASDASVIGNNYYVFLSFRGPDTRNGFVDHLYHRLQDVGLRFHPTFAFKDDKDLAFGENIAANLDSAIMGSKVSIPVISENYAASEWCLREIIQIMECVEKGEQKVYPVLYKVTPSDVRKMTGKFGDAFRRREQPFDKKVEQQGLKALKKALRRKIFESEKFADGREAKLVKALVEKLMSNQQHDFLPSLAKDWVGIDHHVAEVMKLVNTASSETRTMMSTDTTSSETQFIVIYGIGGIGKTTLAMTIYERLFNKFKCHSRLKDIRETIKSKGIKHVQYLHIKNLSRRSDHKEHDSTIEMIRNICERKVLILLDDVDRQDHLDELIGGCKFESGSWIIITCRDKALLNSRYKGYELKEMNRKDSLILFSHYAFKGEQPPIGLMDLSSDIVVKTGGLPLALVIIGSYLKGKDESIWKEMLEKLKVPHMGVQQKLKISYDSLEYEEQQMFLDIACFFIGINKRFVAYLWKDLQYWVDSGLERMIDLSLVKIDDNKLTMHDHLRDLGKVIACPANKKPWECSRLWDEKAITVQRSKEENRYIEALHLDENGSNMFMKRKSFERMHYLKFLHLSKVDFVGDFEDSLSKLRWLEWEECPNSFNAMNVHLEKLVMLDLSGGNMSENWGGWSSIKIKRLKVLNLSRCTALKRTPNLSMFKSLEILVLESCHNWKEIDPSIGDVKCLTSLNLGGCYNLMKLPTQLGELKGLVFLNLSSCLVLQELPESIGKLVNLLTLDLRFCYKLKGLPESIGSLVKLRCLLLGNMPLPSEEMYSDGWDSDQDFCLDNIPYSIGQLKLLTELHLTCAKILELPESIGELKKLKILKIAGCKDLGSLPGTISGLDELEELDATECKSLKGGVPINELSPLKILRLGKICHTADLIYRHIDDNPQLHEDLRLLSSQQHLDLTNCNLPTSLTVLEVTSHKSTLPELSHLTHLKELSFQFCQRLKSIPVLPSRILNLWVFWSGKLKKLPDLSSLELLSELRIIGCSELIKIEGLGGLKSLRELSICGCKKLVNLNGLERLESLRDLEIKGLDEVVSGSPPKPKDGCYERHRRMVKPICLASKDKGEGDAPWIPPTLCTNLILGIVCIFQILFHKARGAEKDEEAIGAFWIFSLFQVSRGTYSSQTLRNPKEFQGIFLFYPVRGHAVHKPYWCLRNEGVAGHYSCSDESFGVETALRDGDSSLAPRDMIWKGKQRNFHSFFFLFPATGLVEVSPIKQCSFHDNREDVNDILDLAFASLKGVVLHEANVEAITGSLLRTSAVKEPTILVISQQWKQSFSMTFSHAQWSSINNK